jgi:hypothetical protein
MKPQAISGDQNPGRSGSAKGSGGAEHRSRRPFVAAAAAAAIALAVSACAEKTKVTGGGTIPSVKYGKANFGFNGNSCKGEVKGNFNYHDKSAWGYDYPSGGVKLHGSVEKAAKCLDVLDPTTDYAPAFCSLVCKKLGLPALGVEVLYESTNPKAPGYGTAWACMRDNGEGAKSYDDQVVIVVKDGPYKGYKNYGKVQGNIQEHGCGEEDKY